MLCQAEWVLPHQRPPATWPQTGEVTFNNYQTRYREGLELVLKGVTCTIKHGEKVRRHYVSIRHVEKGRRHYVCH